MPPPTYTYFVDRVPVFIALAVVLLVIGFARVYENQTLDIQSFAAVTAALAFVPGIVSGWNSRTAVPIQPYAARVQETIRVGEALSNVRQSSVRVRPTFG